MAYLTTFASTTGADVEQLSTDARHLLRPSRIEKVSHFLAYSVTPQPLGKLIGQAIDGGQVINEKLWHPLRPPIFHDIDAVKNLTQQIAQEWEKVLDPALIPIDDWYRIEIEKVIAIFGHAEENQECIVNVLEPPFDEETARRVIIPIAK